MYFSREKELDAVLRTLRSEHAGAVVVVGEPGSGRSTIVQTAAAREGPPIAVVRSSFAETRWEFSGVSAFLAAIDGVLGTELQSRIDLCDLTGSPFDLARRVEVQLRKSVSEDCLLVIDDVDDLDMASQQVLGYIIRRCPSPSMKTLLTMRSAEFGGPFGGIPRVTLEPLDVPTLVELGRSLTSPAANAAVLELAAYPSVGNPLAYKSILGEFGEGVIAGEEALPLPLRPGSELMIKLRPRLEQLSEESRRAFGIVASGPYLPEDILVDFEGLSAVSVEELVAQKMLRRSGGVLTITEPAFGAAAYWGVPAADRIAIHKGLAAAYEERYPGLNAWHRSFFCPSGDLADIMLARSIELVRSGNPAMSVAFTERALGLTGVRVREGLLVRLGKELIDSAEYDMARRVIQFAHRPEASEETRLKITSELLVVDYVQYQTVSHRQVSTLIGLHARVCARGSSASP